MIRFHIQPRPRWRGFSFALYRHGAGLFFLPCGVSATRKRLQRLLSRQSNYTAHATKQRTGLYRRFSCNLSHSTAADTKPTKADITPPAPRWSASQRRSISSIYQIPNATPDVIQVSTAALLYIIRYIRVQQCAPCYGSMPGGASYRRPCQRRRLAIWHRSAVRTHRVSPAPSTRRGSPAAGARRAAPNHWRLAAASFFGLSPDSQ